MKKGKNGTDLENWSLQELIIATDEFLKEDIDINSETKNKEEDNKQNKNENENKKEKEQKQDNNPEKIEQKEGKNISEHNDNNLQCCTIEKTPIRKINELKIEVKNPKIEKGGIFSFSYSTYIVCTPALNFEVIRRHDDFIWLYNILKNHFVNCIVPPIVKKKDIVDENKMKKKLYFLEQFLNDIAKHPILRNCEYFYSFLAIKDEKDFTKAKNEYDKNQIFTNIDKFKTVNGEIKVTFTDDDEQFYKNISSKLNYQETIYDKLLYHFKILLMDINLVSEKMNEIANIWNELFKQKEEYYETKFASEIYSSYNIIMNQWIELQNSNSELIKKSLKRFYRYIKESYECFKPLSLVVEKNKKNYYKKKDKLSYEKERYYAKLNRNEKDKEDNGDNLDIDELQFNKIMINDINKLNEAKRDYGCYLNIYNYEYVRIIDLNDVKLKKNIGDFIKELSLQLSNFISKLNEQLSIIESLN